MVLLTPPVGAVAPSAILSLEVDGSRKSFRLLDPTRIGQSPTCQVRLFGPEIAPVHCEFRRDSGRWILEVEPSAPAVLVNGRAVRRASLSPGDRITIAGVSIDFGQAPAGGGGGSTGGSSPRPASVPDDIESLANAYGELDAARASLDAERESWIARLGVERTRLERERAALRESRLAQQAELDRIRAAALTELAVQRSEVEERAARLDLREQELAARLAAVEERERAHREAVEQFERRQATEAQRLQSSQQSSERLILLAQTRREEMRRDRESLEREKQEWARQREELERDWIVRKRELDGLCERIARERRLLVQLRREHQRIATAGGVLSPVSATSGAIGMQEAAGSRADAETRQAAGSLEAMLATLERAAAAIEAADARNAAERTRLLQLARSIELRERESARESDAVRLLAELDHRAAQIDRARLEVESARRATAAERSRFGAERAAWVQRQGLEAASLKRERERLQQQRRRQAIKRRERLERDRRRRAQIQSEGRAVDFRFGHMLRFEARLEALKQEISLRHLAWLADQRRAAVGPDRSPPSTSADDLREALEAMREEIDAGRRRYEGRLERLLAVFDGAPGRASAAPVATSSPTAAAASVELFLARAEHEADARFWKAEREQYETRIRSLEIEIENLAGSLVAAGTSDWKPL
jgi:hypothetical protein